MNIFSINRSFKRAYYSNKKILFLILTAIFVGALLFGLTYSFKALACDNPPQECVFHVEFKGRTTDSQNNTSTWNYKVYSTGDCPQISHWIWEPCYSLEELNSIFIDAMPDNYSVGFDGSTLHYGVKWEDPSVMNFSITIEGQPEIDQTGATAVIKAGLLGDQNHGSQSHFDFIVPGPSCAVIPDPYCGDGNLDSGEECDDGQDNGVECTPDYGSNCDYCSSECTVNEIEGPYCGDGVVNGPEDCEIDEDCCGQEICVDCICEALPPEPLTIFAYKVVCEKEEDLPNWATAGTQAGEPSVITSSTAIEYVENSEEKCWLEPDWDFQWDLAGEAQKQAGDHIGSAPDGTGWNDFDLPTSTTSPAEVYVYDIGDILRIWVRENLKENYISFSNPPGDVQDDISAEMLCHDDILNFDNYDYINNPQLGSTYYCVAFNALIPEPPEPYCGDGNLDQGEECEIGYDCGCGYTCNLDTCLCESEPPEPFCGDGILDSGEECEVGQTDICSPDSVCNIQTCLCEPEIPQPSCGDGVLDSGEDCDDGQDNGVECNPDYGSSCNYCSLSCDIIELQGGYCGDGVVNGSEDCEIDEDCCPGMSCVECSCYTPITYFISGLKFNDKNNNGLKDNSIEPGLEEWVITIEGPYQFNDSTTTDEEGRYKFPGLIPGSYTICEELETGWEQTYPTENDGCHIIEIIDGSISEVNFGNHQLPYCGDGNLDPGEECEVGQECNAGYSCNIQTCLCEQPTECTPEDTQPCPTGELGICSSGTQTCDSEGFWGECIQDLEPTTEICDNGLDDNCDGYTDCDDEGCITDPVCQPGPGPELFCGDGLISGEEECDDGNTEDGDGCSAECVIELPPQPECTPEDTQPCPTGELGICSSGTQTCDSEGFWGECEQDNESVTEICNNGLDDDCDGDVDCDDGDCEGDPYCGGGPQPPTCTPEDTRACGTGLLGICSSGTQICNSQGFWGICGQNNQPISEICNNGLDDDCDGATNCSDSDCIVTLSCYIAPPGPTCLDLDSDGYNAYASYCLSGTDCDDSNPNINPGVSEVCNNSVDDDCDDDIDCQDSDCIGDESCGKGGPVCTDSDGDSFAVEGGGCGSVDCDDTNSDINPGVNEVCNNQTDDDCDGDVDCDDGDCEGDSYCGGSGGPVCTDLDEDSYFVEGGDCGLVDCDDTNSDINPGVSEVCNNGLDDDCDGDTDCSDSDCVLDPYCTGGGGEIVECEPGNQQDCDTDLMGICSVGTQTCNGEGFWDECLADYEASFEICDNGLDDDCDGSTDCDDSDCSNIISCMGGGEEEEEEESFVASIIAQAGNAVSNLVASVIEAISNLLGFFTNGKGLCLCLPPCLPWWLILILFLCSAVKTIRVWKKDNKEKRTWLVWTLVLLILTVCFLFKIFICLTFWILVILVVCTYLIYRSLKQKEEEEATYKLFE